MGSLGRRAASRPLSGTGSVASIPLASSPLARKPLGDAAHETRQVNEPTFTMIYRGHQCLDAIPAAEAVGLKAGSVMRLKNARGLSTPSGPPLVRTLEAHLSKDPQEYADIDALLGKNAYGTIFPAAVDAASAAAHYRSVFSRNADRPVVLLTFKKDPDLVVAP